MSAVALAAFVLLGAALAAATIALARRFGGEPWMYAAGVIGLPLIYAGFGLADGDTAAAGQEVLVGLPFLVGAVVALTVERPWITTLVGVLWLLHGAYDVFHDSFVDNAGVPDWYQAACAGTDVVIGLYLLALARRRVSV